MAGNGALNEYQVFLRKDLEDLEVLDLGAFAAGAAAHAHSFKNPCRIRGSADRTGSSLPVMLAVGSVVDTAEAVALYDTLKSFSLSGSNGVDQVAFREYFVNFNNITNGFFDDVKIAKFNHLVFRTCFGLVEMPQESLGCVLGLRFTETDLQSRVAVRLLCLNLRDDAGAGFDYGAGHIIASRIKYAGHSNFLTD